MAEVSSNNKRVKSGLAIASVISVVALLAGVGSSQPDTNTAKTDVMAPAAYQADSNAASEPTSYEPAIAEPTPEPEPTYTSSYSTPEPELEDDCNPNYSGCVENSSYDLDCPDIGHMVSVIGDDEYNLDRDGDGYGCESYR